MYLSLQDKYRKQYTPPYIRDLRKFRYTDVHEIIWKITKPRPGKKVNDLNVTTVIPLKQKQREKVVIAFRLYRKYLQIIRIINNRAKALTLSGLWTILSLFSLLPSNKLTQSLLQKRKIILCTFHR